MTRLLVNGIRLETRTAGDGLPILLLHGFTGRGASWRPHLAALRRDRRTIVVDLPGHGRSDAPADPARYEVERVAGDLAQLLSMLGAVPSDVVGYSLGARIALRLVLDHPATVRRLVLESPSCGIADPTGRRRRMERDEALATRLERDGIEAFVAAWETQPLFASHALLPGRARDRLRRARLRNRPIGLANCLRGAGQGKMEPLCDRLGEVTAPALVVAGPLDPIGAERAVAICRQLPAGRVAIIEGAGHTPHLERPAAFRRVVLAFFAEPSTYRE